MGEFECRSPCPLSPSLLLQGQTRATRSRGFLLELSAPHSPLYIPGPSQQQLSSPLPFGGTFPVKVREGCVFPGPAEPAQVFHDDNICRTLASAQMHFPVYLQLLDDLGALSTWMFPQDDFSPGMSLFTFSQLSRCVPTWCCMKA